MGSKVFFPNEPWLMLPGPCHGQPAGASGNSRAGSSMAASSAAT